MIYIDVNTRFIRQTAPFAPRNNTSYHTITNQSTARITLARIASTSKVTGTKRTNGNFTLEISSFIANSHRHNGNINFQQIIRSTVFIILIRSTPTSWKSKDSNYCSTIEAQNLAFSLNPYQRDIVRCRLDPSRISWLYEMCPFRQMADQRIQVQCHSVWIHHRTHDGPQFWSLCALAWAHPRTMDVSCRPSVASFVWVV